MRTVFIELIADDSTAFPITIRKAGDLVAVRVPSARLPALVERIPDMIRDLCSGQQCPTSKPKPEPKPGLTTTPNASESGRFSKRVETIRPSLMKPY